MEKTFRIKGAGWLQKYISSDDEVIEFGCGLMPVTRKLKCKKLIGIDAWHPYIEQLQNELLEKQHIYLCHFEINETALSIFINSKSTDICLAIDVVEHFEKPDAMNLILQMERIARKRVIIFTPIGFVSQERDDNTELQRHRCGFIPKELEKMGYETYIRTGGDIPSFLAVKTF